ncbi:MAG: Methionyl-tRNA synthetase beta subunit [Candidatus Roizmanbacteria bacterium GW2011_GWA2_36_23]|uniref:Methionyl-tRNA synthetase beta subunit n=1 Tax=Candidatus Roizmanbacteria bacterium GW2011_GWA2_36_23 TaxID=1618480 RepID=A0A0G0GQZ6_9BACT|nr:MAG: Methionyl-tRNA synthetase beta subunit [Candidatus Roizmanbacteria bacterium GW2011_GWA2_36_23]
MKKDNIAFADFMKLDMRVGEVVEAGLVENSRNLIKLTVDLGVDYGQVIILSGIAKWYSPADLVGNKYIFLANLQPKQIMGMLSNGMILVVDNEEKPVLIELSKDFINGQIVR